MTQSREQTIKNIIMNTRGMRKFLEPAVQRAKENYEYHKKRLDEHDKKMQDLENELNEIQGVIVVQPKEDELIESSGISKN